MVTDRVSVWVMLGAAKLLMVKQNMNLQNWAPFQWGLNKGGE